MIKYDERFFILNKCVFNKDQKTILVSFYGVDNFEPEIPKHERSVLRQMDDAVHDTKIRVDFEYLELPTRNVTGDIGEKLAELNSFEASLAAKLPPTVDKILPVRNIEPLLGVAIKIRPTRIKYLRNSPDFQVTAGTIHFLKRREYTRNDVTKAYYTFMLDDGADRVQCVFFPTEKTRAKFEKLKDRSVVAIIGVYEKRNDRQNFRVTGASYCELGRENNA